MGFVAIDRAPTRSRALNLGIRKLINSIVENMDSLHIVIALYGKTA